MKKLVLIPHERYEQFLSRESKEHSVQPESTEKQRLLVQNSIGIESHVEDRYRMII